MPGPEAAVKTEGYEGLPQADGTFASGLLQVMETESLFFDGDKCRSALQPLQQAHGPAVGSLHWPLISRWPPTVTSRRQSRREVSARRNPSSICPNHLPPITLRQMLPNHLRPITLKNPPRSPSQRLLRSLRLPRSDNGCSAFKKKIPPTCILPCTPALCSQTGDSCAAAELGRPSFKSIHTD